MLVLGVDEGGTWIRFLLVEGVKNMKMNQRERERGEDIRLSFKFSMNKMIVFSLSS